MAPLKSPQELYTPRTIATLGGASFMVVITTSVAADIIGFTPQYLKILAFIVAEIFAFIGAVLVPRPSPVVYIVAFFNGFLIYATASGLNAMNNSPKATKAQQASIVPFIDTVAWWPPAELAELQTVTGDVATTVGKVVDPVQRASSVLKDISLPLKEERVKLEKRLSDLAAERGDLKKRSEGLVREAPLPVHPAERESVERRRAEERTRLEKRLSVVEQAEKETKENLEEVARLDKPVSRLQELVGGYAESGVALDDAQKQLTSATKVLRMAYETANHVTGLKDPSTVEKTKGAGIAR